MNQFYPHSIHETIADNQHPGDIFFLQAKNLVAQG